MAFSEATKTQAIKRAGYRCECKRGSHMHGRSGRCIKALTKGVAEFHHKLAVASGGGDGLSNCEVLCRPCHARVRRPR
jgi:5-methylcytosine-specific restriction endonuclease McrA